jgi:hypothetical protein
MRFSTLPQVLAYYRSVQYGRGAEGKVEIIGAFLETNSLADLFRGTVDADVVRPEHHIDLPFLVHTADEPQSTDEDDGGLGDSNAAERLELVRALARRGELSTLDRSFRVCSWRVPMRGLPSATGSMRQTPHADLLLATPEAVAVASVRASEHHPLIGIIEGLNHLAHLNKARISERVRAELAGRWSDLGGDLAIDEVVLVAPRSYYERFANDDRERRSGWTNAHVAHKARAELREAGIRLSLVQIEGDWQRGFFTASLSDYARPIEA